MTENATPSTDDRLKHLNEVFRTFRTIIRETDPERMLEQSCRLLTKTHGYTHAMINLIDAQGKVKQMFQAGAGEAFLELKEKLLGDGDIYCFVEALKQPGVIVIDNRHRTCGDCPFFMKYSGGHGVVVRLEHQDRVYGTLTVYSDQKLVGSRNEHEFIGDIADDIAYSLFNMEQKDIRRKEREALSASEERFRKLFENSASGVAIYEAVDGGKNFIFRDFNKKAEQIENINRADVIGKPINEVFPGAEVFGILDVLRRVWLTGNPEYAPAAKYQDERDPGSWRENWVYKLPGNEIVVVYNDITERKTAEAALLESEQRHRSIFNNFPDAIFIADTESGHIVDANPAAANLLRMPLEKIIGMHQTKLHPPEKKTESKEIFERHKSDAERKLPSSLNEAVVLRSDGERIPVEIKAQLVPIKGKLCLQGVFRDISRRKESESVLRSIFKASPAGIGHVGPDRTLLRVNEKICEMTGRPQEALVGQNARILYPTTQDYDAVGKNKYAQIREKGTGIVETRWVRQNGEIIDVLISSALIDPADFSKGTIFSALDITELKQAEKEVLKLSQAVEQSPASIVITDLDGCIEYVNPKFTQITGYSLEEVKGKNPNILKSDTTSPEEYQKLWETITSGNTWEGEFHNKTKDGAFFWEKATIGPIFNEKNEIINYLAVKKDISEQKILEEQLRQSQKMEAIGLLAGGVAHDFNNLLTIINGYSGIILADLDRSNPVFEKVQQIMAAGDRAAALTRQLLAFSRKQVLRPEIVNINSLISGMETLLRRLIGEDIDLVIIYSDLLKTVRADRGQIEQVIMNLAVNARDAMPAGGCLTFETKNIIFDESYAVSHPDVKPGEYVMFSIADTGEGISKEIREHIFDPFFTTKEPGKGTGLGLSTVYGIIRQSRGSIRVKSEPDKGSVFEIYLPVFDGTGATGSRSPGAASVSGSETILIVEDEENVRDLTVLSLTRMGYHVLQAANGEEALEVLEEFSDRIRLVMTDVVMPQMGGLELAEKVIRQYPDIQLLFISGYTNNSVVERGILGRKISFMQKPFPLHELARKVRELLDRR